MEAQVELGPAPQQGVLHGIGHHVYAGAHRKADEQQVLDCLGDGPGGGVLQSDQTYWRDEGVGDVDIVT